MKYRNIILCATVVCLGFAMPACKKSDTGVEKKEIIQVEQPLAQAPAEIVIPPIDYNNWDKTRVNNLLAFVPADSPMVLASTREFDFNSPTLKTYLTRVQKIATQLKTLLNDQMKAVTHDDHNLYVDDALKRMNELLSLYEDYNKNAPSFGLNPDHCDYIYYADNLNLVFKFTVDDGNILKEKLHDYIDTLSLFHLVSEDTLKINKDIKIGKHALDEFIPADLSSAYDVGYLLNHHKTHAQNPAQDSTRILVHYDKNVVSIIFTANNTKPDEIDRLLTPVKSPITLASLGTVSPDVAALGFLDISKITDSLLNSPQLKSIMSDIFDTHLEPECNNEIKTFISDYPRMNLVYRFIDENTLKIDSTLVMTSSQDRETLKSLHSKNININSDKTLVGIKFNFILEKLLNYLIAKNNKEYSCTLLKDYASQFSILKMMSEDSESDEGKIYALVKDISGFSIALNGFSSVADSTEIDFVSSMSGPLLDRFISLMSSDIPELTQLTVGAPKPISFSNRKFNDGKPLLIYRTTNDLFLASKGQDILKFANLAPEEDESLLTLTIDSEVIRKLFQQFIMDEDSAADTKDKDELDLNRELDAFYNSVAFQSKMTVIPDDTGLTMSFYITFK